MSLIILNVDEVRRTLSTSGGAFVVHDKEVDIVRFAINSGFADIVLDGQVALRVMYQRPGESQVRAQTLTYHDTDGLRNYYDWNLLPSDLAEKGTLTVALCILRTDEDVEEWHTTPCRIRVLDTIHTDDSDEGDETITPTVAERVAVLEAMIQRVASGAPIVVTSTSAMTDTDKIYVLKTDRCWYYYDGSAWVAGGEYGAVATDRTLTQENIPADAKAVGDENTDLKGNINATALYQIVYPDIVRDKGVATISPSYVNKSVKTATGKIGSTAPNRITNDALIYIPDGATFGVTITDPTNYYLPSRFCFDKNKVFIGIVQTSNGAVAEGTVYVRLMITKKDNGNLTPEDAQSVVTVTLTKQTAHAEIRELENGLPAMIEQAMFEPGFNKFDPNTTVAGFIASNAGAINPAGTYFTSDFIDVSEFRYGYAFTPRARKILFYDANKTAITESYYTNETDAGVITLNSDYKYIRLSWYSTSTNIMVADAATLPTYVPYEIVAKDGVNYLNADTKTKIRQMIGDGGKQTEIAAFLNGKTIAVFGDSIMYGAGSDSKGAVDLLAEKYGMTVNKYAVSGSTMGVRTDNPSYTVDEVHHIAKQVRNAIAAGITPDLIVFNGGTNDIGGNIQIGEMTQVYTEPSSESYFADGFETVAYLLKKNFVGVPIIYMRAHNMSSRSYSGQIEYGELGNRIAEKWGIRNVDMYKRMNTQLEEYRTLYLADYTHPNAVGYNKYYIPALEDFIFSSLI